MQLIRKERTKNRRVETAAREELQEIRLVTSSVAESREVASSEVQQRVEERIDAIIELLASELESEPKQLEQPEPQPRTRPVAESNPLDLSIVLPCFNQEDTIGDMVLQAQFAIERLGLRGEVLVADEGSTDDSVELAEQLGARVINSKTSGNDQLQGSLNGSSGRLLLMGDASSLQRWLPPVSV